MTDHEKEVERQIIAAKEGHRPRGTRPRVFVLGATDGARGCIPAHTLRSGRRMAIRLGALCLWLLVAAAEAASSPRPEQRGWIAVDIGHTLALPGATSARGLTEFSFNRTFGGMLAAGVAAAGGDARLVNADGMIESLPARGRAAAGSRLLVAVHHDSVQPRFFSTWTHEGVERPYSDRNAGFSLFVSRKNIALEASLACASAMGAALRAAGFSPSLYHAERIAGEAKPYADRTNGVHYYDNLIVLKSMRGPAVLFEAGVIVSRDEELQLLDDERRSRMARALAAAIVSCSSTAVGRTGARGF